MFQLNADCLFEIFRCLEGNKATLHSCLLVNRFWCKISVRILWETPDVSAKLLNTLISCLPDESKNILHNNGIIFPNLNSLCPPGDHLFKKEVTLASTSKPPSFNYASFCKVLSISKIYYSVAETFLNNRLSINTKEIINLTQEILKLFMNVSSLKHLSYTSDDDHSPVNIKTPTNITFVHFPGAEHCLTYLSEFACTSNINSGILNQLSKICHNIQSLNIKFNKYADNADRVSDGLKNLISSQNNLKSLSLTYYNETNCWVDIIPSVTMHSDTLTKLSIKSVENHWPISFIKDFKNLRELDISLIYLSKDDAYSDFGHFEDLQHFIFPYLKRFNINLPTKVEPIVIKFLENNGENLEEFQCKSKCKNNSTKTVNFAVNKHCPRLKSLHTTFYERLSGISLKLIFMNCKELESIEILRRGTSLSGKELLEVIAQHSPKNFHELKLHNFYEEIDHEDLESFFISWKKRSPRKLFTLIFKDVCPETNNEKEGIIRKYEKEGLTEILRI
ncbi:hypothetical protein RclHR1_00380051 [Rhizophagus clarus]|uniref:F-box domain-containing protein n=1 Tax=Rhizophagus clarus TaxID=94130 RepID=A0A2Z6RGU4_9GLOM|nr:hypothetical protein RclHR1_00380051 [Rhizophagus clarus]GET01472.1 hypothetical protein GLOIN_2v1876445 [Rhizophagus clarus]